LRNVTEKFYIILV